MGELHNLVPFVTFLYPVRFDKGIEYFIDFICPSYVVLLFLGDEKSPSLHSNSNTRKETHALN